MARARTKWQEDQPALDPAKLVFVDETGTATNMTRRRGRCRRGERLVGRVPHGHWKTTTFVAGLRREALTAPFVVDQPMNGDIFKAYVERCLAPSLAPGDIVIMDNLASHKSLPLRKRGWPASVTPSSAPARPSSTCRPIRPISIPSNRPSPSSRRYCARPPHDPSPPYGMPSAYNSTPSRPSNVEISSPTEAMGQTSVKPL